MDDRQDYRSRSACAEMVLLPVVAIGATMARSVCDLVACKHGMIESW